MRTAALLALSLLLVAPAGASLAVADGSAAPAPCAGRVADPAGGTTIVSIQGARFGEDGAEKTAARVVAYGPNGSVEWVFHGAERLGIVWSYDVDPLPNGNLFLVGTRSETTLLYELDPSTGRVVWSEELPLTDTHDADVIGPHRIAIANMRNYDEANGTNDDRLVIYNRTSGEFEWQWLFREHYPRDAGGDYAEDWTHVNDVDAVGEHYFLLSPRNLDQVILVDRRTGEIALRLGSDGAHGTLYEQHNPDYLESESGSPTFLVADSENDRIVEYERANGEWTRTWTVGSSETLTWPRDADRLANGNTLIGDSRNNRVLEVTPTGEVVWEVYAPWLVYDVERLPGDGSRGPTIADQGAAGSYDLSGASPPETAALERCSRLLANADSWTTEANRTTTTPTPSETVRTFAWTEQPDERDEIAVTVTDDPRVRFPASPFVAAVAAVAALVLGGAAVLVRRR